MNDLNPHHNHERWAALFSNTRRGNGGSERESNVLEVTQRVEGRNKNSSLLTPGPRTLLPHPPPSQPWALPPCSPSHGPSHTLGPALLPSVTEAAGTASFGCPLRDAQRRGLRRGPPPSMQGREPKPVCLRWGQCGGSFSASTYGTIDGRSSHQTRDKS